MSGEIDFGVYVVFLDVIIDAILDAIFEAVLEAILEAIPACIARHSRHSFTLPPPSCLQYAVHSD